MSHLAILGARRVTKIKFHADDPQLLVATVQKSVATTNCRPGLVHRCLVCSLWLCIFLLFVDGQFKIRSIQAMYIFPTYALCRLSNIMVNNLIPYHLIENCIRSKLTIIGCATPPPGRRSNNKIKLNSYMSKMLPLFMPIIFLVVCLGLRKWSSWDSDRCRQGTSEFVSPIFSLHLTTQKHERGEALINKRDEIWVRGLPCFVLATSELEEPRFLFTPHHTHTHTHTTHTHTRARARAHTHT